MQQLYHATIIPRSVDRSEIVFLRMRVWIAYGIFTVKLFLPLFFENFYCYVCLDINYFRFNVPATYCVRWHHLLDCKQYEYC